MKILVIDCCIRGEKSGTRRLLEGCLEDIAVNAGVTSGENVEIERLNLMDEDLQPFTAEMVDRRIELVKASRFDDSMFRYARQFASADEIIIAAPYWDWSFPALLKIYLENVSVSEITFTYRGPEPTGLCKAKRIRYLSTCGGFTGGNHEGVNYIRRIGGAFGINQVLEYTVEGLDMNPAERERVLQEGIARVKKMLETERS